MGTQEIGYGSGRGLAAGSPGRVIHRQIEYSPLPSQEKFHAMRARFKGFSGPVGSGKSMALVQEAIRLSAVNAGLLGMIGAPTYTMLRDITQRAIFEELERSDIPFTFVKQPNLLVLKDLDSEILFRSLDQPERLRGTNIAWLGVDELTFCKKASWLRLLARVRHPLAKELCAFGVWTPNGFDWVYDTFISTEKLPGHEAILARPYENRHLAADFYQTLETAYDSKFAAQEVKGEYLSLKAGQAYHAFTRSGNMGEVEFSSRRQLCWSLDFNVNPMSSVIAQLEDVTTREMMMMGRRRVLLHVLDEIVLPNSNTEQACEEFARRVEPWISGHTPIRLQLYGDAAGAARSTAGKSDYQIIREFFRRHAEFDVLYHVPSANPAVRDRVNAVNGKLKNATGEIGLVLNPRCKRLIKDLEQVNWKADSNGNVTGDLDKSNPELTHISDALGYLVEKEFGLRQMGGPRSTPII